MNSSVTLVDAMVVIYGHEQGWFTHLAERIPLAITGQVAREAAYFKLIDGTKIPIDLTPLIERGVLQREEATVHELAAFAAACPRSGLGSGETESLAIIRTRGLAFCTADIHAMRVMQLLGLETLWRSIERLLITAALDTSALRKHCMEDAWPS